MDLQFIQFQDALAVNGAQEIPDLSPRCGVHRGASSLRGNSSAAPAESILRVVPTRGGSLSGHKRPTRAEGGGGSTREMGQREWCLSFPAGC